MDILPKKRVVIIGAGMSGLVCAKSLLDQNIEPVIFEKREYIGGLWAFNPDPTVHSCYNGLATNTYKKSTAFRGFPMPEEYPNQPTNSQILEYFKSYAEHFGLYKYITFNASVAEICQLKPSKGYNFGPSDNVGGDSQWKTVVQSKGQDTEIISDAVAICNGHHWDEIVPTDNEVPGLSSFTGVTLHSHCYRHAQDWAGKRVLVSGLGISGSDIIRELIGVAACIVVSSRRVPYKEETLFDKISSVFEDEPEEDDHSQRRSKPHIKKINGSKVTFHDGTIFSSVDVIIWCWGYRYNFPFLKSMKILEKPSRLPLYKHVFDPHLKGLAFIGLPTVDGSLHPIAERQSIWFSKILAGEISLPPVEEMQDSIKKWDEAIVKYGIKYRPMQVSLSNYLLPELEKLGLTAADVYWMDREPEFWQ